MGVMSEMSRVILVMGGGGGMGVMSEMSRVILVMGGGVWG